MQSLISATGFEIVLGWFAVGFMGALISRSHDRLANSWSHLFAAIGSLSAMALAAGVLLTGQTISITQPVGSFPLLALNFHIDQLAASFMLAIAIVALFCSIYGAGYVKHYFGKYNIGVLGFLYNAFIASMLLVVTASNAITFLIVWEIMSLSSFFMVMYDRHDPENIKAGYLYLIMTHIGTAFITLAFLLLYGATGSFDFAAIKSGAHHLPELTRAAVFVLAFVGFGTKAGVIPLHIWLPSAHPAAPSHVSALMSGVMIKTGIYMMIRLFLDLLQPIPTWWGITVVIMGSISCVLGVLYALTEHDLKRLLAYHSIENIGIILLGVGSAMIFSSINQPALMVLALAAALFHALNHAIFKSLLFLSAGSVIMATHTRDIEKYGGLLRVMPLTGAAFLIGSMAISALPPFNGFFSEWLTYQSLLQGATSGNLLVQWVLIIGVASLALTGGLALACFVKAFGATFLARPRSLAVERAHETSRWMHAGMIGLTALCIALGIGSGQVIMALQSIGQHVTGLGSTAQIATITAGHFITLGGNWAAISGPAIAIAIIFATLAVWIWSKYGVYPEQKTATGLTWDCGTDLDGRMEITSTGFARSIILMFQGILRPTMQHTLEYDDAASRYMPKTRTVALHVTDVYRKYTYTPIYEFSMKISQQVKAIQNGNLNAYVLYIFLILVVLLLVGV